MRVLKTNGDPVKNGDDETMNVMGYTVDMGKLEHEVNQGLGDPMGVAAREAQAAVDSGAITPEQGDAYRHALSAALVDRNARSLGIVPLGFFLGAAHEAKDYNDFESFVGDMVNNYFGSVVGGIASWMPEGVGDVFIRESVKKVAPYLPRGYSDENPSHFVTSKE